MVDWWFVYKVAKDATAPNAHGRDTSEATGYEHVYFDDHSEVLAGSKDGLSDPSCALERTLAQLSKPAGKSIGRVFYNDEYPEEMHKSNDEGHGHCKGVLAFDQDTDSAFWLLHSTPRYPAPGAHKFPSDELDYGQTFLCVTLKDVATAEAIAKQMLSQQGPQTYGATLPASASSVWHDLANEHFDLSKDPSDIFFQSKAGHHFRSIAKSKHWGQDLWTDLVGPALKTDLDVETWRRGADFGDEDSDKKHDVVDVVAIDLTPLGVPYAWPETKDHAKWASSLKGTGDWVCVADINRQKSQAKRGGGSICFQHSKLWASLAKIDRSAAGEKKR